MNDEWEAIGERLKTVIGLDTASVGASTVALAVRRRMKARGLSSPGGYQELLERSEAEWERLVEEVVVPETWFFRDRHPFAALAKWALETWFPAHPSTPMRLLSMPCSTGEEPFSMVMALLQAGVPEDRFEVEAVDISAVALGRAREGLYGRNSFRGPAAQWREAFFTEIAPGSWRLAEAVRRKVHFRQRNLLDPAFARVTGAKDVIFCRNVLIYFDAAAQQRLLGTIGELLAPGGLLFAGHAEAYLFTSAGYESAAMPMAFAFQRRKEAPPQPRRVAVRRTPPPRKQQQPPVPRPAPVPAPPPAPSPPKAPPPTLLDESQRLADAGLLREAAEKAEASIGKEGPSARAFYLLGLVKDAAGLSAQAVAFYRKALYLDPQHRDTLAQMALLARRNGDGPAAQRLRQRLERLDSPSS